MYHSYIYPVHHVCLSTKKKKNYKVYWKVKKQTNKQTQFEETEQASESDSDMTWTLELSDKKFKRTIYDQCAKDSNVRSRQHVRTNA